MSSLVEGVKSRHAGYLDDEIAAMNLQLEEISHREQTKKGKYASSNVPDLEIAYADFFLEVEGHLQFLRDAKLAHSIANAIESDAQVIAEFSRAEFQAQEDRRVAVKMSGGDDHAEAPPPYTEGVAERDVETELVGRFEALIYSEEASDEDTTSVAGPSEPYARRQANALEKMSQRAFQCTACLENFRLANITQLQCEHDYCDNCLKEFIMRSVVDHDLALIPPRCCGMPLADSTIENTLNDEEMKDFQDAVTEKNTKDKTYCSNAECGRFIAPEQIEGDCATCSRCGVKTCTMCKGAFHEDDCPADPALQETLNMGVDNGWQRCFSCRSLVAIARGCNHMTCRCGAQFCYGCGAEWANGSQCRCDLWTEANLYDRAAQVVDRQAPVNIRPVERQHRIERMQEQLRNTDECDHRGKRKFEKIIGTGKTRFQCEMCNERHRQFILRCRRCQLDVCMDCRLHRV